MKQLYSLLVMALLVLAVLPAVMAVSTGSVVTPDITTEKFVPQVWMCDHRVWIDDAVEANPWNQIRENNYAFEGEKITWKVLVMDKNGIDKVKDVFATVGESQGSNPEGIEVNCQRLNDWPEDHSKILDSCNARIQEEQLTTFDSNTMSYYECTLTVETAESPSFYGPNWVTVEAVDLDDQSGVMAENEHWFFNPEISLSVIGDLTFSDVRPGTASYSSTLLLGNDADSGSGVILDMFMAGTDFYDSSSSGAKCPTSNVLDLSNFRYYATNGAYSTKSYAPLNGADAEGYVGIAEGNRIDQSKEIIGTEKFLGTVNPGNTLTPGSDMSVTFKLNMPEPCNGDFNTGSIYFWGEAI
jgi:hypothetical protein